MVDTAGVVRWLVNGGDACRVCYGAVGEGAVSLKDAVAFDEGHDADELTVRDILADVAGTLTCDVALPEYLCSQCAYSAIASFTFLHQCRTSHRRLHDITRTLSLADDLVPSSLPTRHPRALILHLDGDRIAVRSHRYSLPDAQAALSQLNILPNGKSTTSKDITKAVSSEEIEDEHLLTCYECQKTFTCEESLLQHKCVTERSGERAMCALCGAAYADLRSLQQHTARAHTDKSIPCSDCADMFASRALLREHFKNRHVKTQCRECRLSFVGASAMRSHAHAQHRGPWTCNGCQREWRSRQGLNKHREKCVEGVTHSFPCTECDRSYSSAANLECHRRYAHSSRAYTCDHCGNKYIDRSKLKCHMSTHTGIKLYSCDVCHKAFKFPNTLVYHMRASHTGERPYACLQCDERFITSARRLAHARRAHGALGPTCAHCGHSFTTNAHLARHVRMQHTAG